MNQAAKLFWGEGLFLRPQHFQRQDAYHEGRLHDLSQSLHPYGWGVRQARFDHQGLANGVLRPLQLSVIFPDGTLLNAPDAEELPAPISLANLPAGTTELTIHLALPILKENGGNVTDTVGDEATRRYRKSDVTTADIYTDAAEADIAYLAKSIRLLTDEQPRDAFTSVPVARLRRLSTGGFEIDPHYLPPAVSLRASPVLFLQLRRLLDALQAKAQALVGLHREPSQHIIEFRSGDIASFWLLHTVNSAFAALAHFHQHPGLAPERLHQELSRLAGALLTFSPAYQLADLPAYQHADPGPGFDKLFRIIRELIDTVISARYFGIALTEVKPSYHLGRIDSQRIDDKSAFYLAVAAAMPAAELVSVVPIRFKIGAPDDVEKAVLSALPGVSLSHVPQVPAAIPVRPGSTYFAIEPRGTLYERMLKSQSMMIYVPAGMAELKLELVAVTP